MATMTVKKNLKPKHKSLEDHVQEHVEFAYIVSHDLSAPLRHLRSFTDLLVENLGEDVDEKTVGYRDHIQSAVNKTEGMVQGLLQYSRLNTTAKEMLPVKLNDVIKTVELSMADVLRENSVTLTVKDLPQIRCDARQVGQLFSGMIDNAIKFRDKERPLEIEISAEQHEDMWLFAVKDNAIGIAKPFRQHIFEMFKKVDINDERGAGTGLSIAKKIVDRHGGLIWCESEEGVGSTFYFSAPAL